MEMPKMPITDAHLIEEAKKGIEKDKRVGLLRGAIPRKLEQIAKLKKESEGLSEKDVAAYGEFAEAYVLSVREHIIEITPLLKEQLLMHTKYLNVLENRLNETTDERAREIDQESIKAEQVKIEELEAELTEYKDILSSVGRD